MATTTHSGKEPSGIDNRTRRAAEGCMVTVPHDGGSGRFEVYSATDGHNEIYTVDLRAETCDCADHKHRRPEDGCKHIRRVKLGLGLMAVPAGIELDGCLVDTRAKYGVDPGSTAPIKARTPDSSGQEAGAVPTAVTDGGQLIEAPDDGVILDDSQEDDDDDGDGDDARELRAATHTIALDAYEARPLPDFDVFGEIIACSTASVRRAVETEAGQ